MIQLGPRIGAKADLFKPLYDLFTANYPSESLPEIEEILRRFQILRDEICNPLALSRDVKSCEGYITKAKDYLALHVSIFKCVSSAALKVKLTWKDSVSDKQIVLSDPLSEQVIIRFNIGITTYNQAQLLNEARNYKEAMNQFHIASTLLGTIRGDATILKIEEIDVNFSDHYLQLVMNLCKAMVQFCMIEMKTPELLETPKLVLSRICKCASDFFYIARGNATLPTLQPPLKKIISKSFIASLLFAHKLYNAFAYFYAARVYGDDTINNDPMKTIGYAIGLLEESKKLFNEIKDSKDILSFVKNVYSKDKSFVETKTNYIEQRNKNIYRELPTTKLPIIEPLEYPKKINLEEVLQSNVPGRDLLRRVIPIKIIDYEKEYKSVVETLKTKAEDEEKKYEEEEKKFFEAHELFQRLFDAQDIQSNYEFPGDLLKKLEKIHLKEGILGLRDIYECIIGETANWNYFVSKCEEKLIEEEKKYNLNKNELGKAWIQVPVWEVNKHFKEGVKEGRGMIEDAKSQCELYNVILNHKSGEQVLLLFISTDINDLMIDIPKSMIMINAPSKELMDQ
jgi:hypothetical protein